MIDSVMHKTRLVRRDLKRAQTRRGWSSPEHTEWVLQNRNRTQDCTAIKDPSRWAALGLSRLKCHLEGQGGFASLSHNQTAACFAGCIFH